METLKRFRLIAVRAALLLTFITAAIAFKFDQVIAKGLLMGGLAGIIGFWIMAVKLEKLALRGKEGVYSDSVQLPSVTPALWRMAEMLLYLAVLWRAYSQEGGSIRALLAAAAGLFIIRIVVVILGMTGLDLKRMDE